MEAGAALELATIYAPPAFLPLACTANLSKNLAAVAASSTRAPIYRTFALQVRAVGAHVCGGDGWGLGGDVCVCVCVVEMCMGLGGGVGVGARRC